MPLFYLLRVSVLMAASVLCLTLLTACDNNAPADQLTLVQGTVTSADSGRPLPGVLLAIESYKVGILGPVNYQLTGDSVRTDASGRYQLRFTNAKGLYYVVGLDPLVPPYYRSSRFIFGVATAHPSPVGPEGHPELGSVKLGTTNTFDFKPNELRTVAVRIRNRNTGYQLLDFNYKYLHGNNLDTVAYLRNYYLPPVGVKFGYRKLNAANQVLKDTAVALVVQNPAAYYPDTVRATLTFVR